MATRKKAKGKTKARRKKTSPTEVTKPAEKPGRSPMQDFEPFDVQLWRENADSGCVAEPGRAMLASAAGVVVAAMTVTCRRTRSAANVVNWS